jgi:hypothetical protein
MFVMLWQIQPKNISQSDNILSWWHAIIKIGVEYLGRSEGVGNVVKKSISGIRSFLYALARFLGDVDAVSKGSKATQKRIGRRIVGRATGKALRNLFK